MNTKALKERNIVFYFYSNNYYAIHSSYFDSSSEFNFCFTPSLSVEWQFYILYPLLVIIVKNYGFLLTLIICNLAMSLAITLMRVTGTKKIFSIHP